SKYYSKSYNSEKINSDQQTAIGFSNVSNTVDEPVEIQTESGGKRKTRGRTLLKDLYDLNSVEHVKVSRNSHGQLIGSKARLLTRNLSIIARNANMLPINFELWHHMPDSNKNQALGNIKVITFALEISNNYVKKDLGKKWKDHKSTLKKEYFKKNISLEEKLRNASLEMLRYQWEDAVRFWNSKKGEELSFGLKVRRLQLFDITHRKKDESLMTTEAAEIMELSSGLKVRRLQLFDITYRKKDESLMNIETAEIMELSSGLKVGHLQLFDVTHRKKDESLMTTEAAEIMEKLKDKRMEYEVIASSDSSVNLDDIDNRIIIEVLGPERYGRVRFQEFFVNPTQYFGSNS
ncbi:hypothetical protein J1N35_015419, partial [Gossypium stocksii]